MLVGDSGALFSSFGELSPVVLEPIIEIQIQFMLYLSSYQKERVSPWLRLCV